MKKKLSLLLISALAVFAVLVMMPSCEGPAGPAGVDGVDGTDGTDGVDANSFCIDCHSLDNKTTINSQYATSSHGMGNYAGYAGGRSGCAKCHSYQGAMETSITGMDTTAANIPIPVAFKCENCHDFHMSLEEENFPDYALSNTDPVSLISDGHMTIIDLAGSGNACAQCHQTRRMTEPYGSPDSVNVSSTHWGGHHGPQGNLLAGQGAFEPVGSVAYGNSAHTDIIGCSDCHMVKDASRTDVGGHTWGMMAEDGYQNMGACTGCHTDATSFDVNGKQTEITGLLEDLHHLLVQYGLYSEEGLHEGGHPVTSSEFGRKHTSEEGGAVFNYIIFEEDRSIGVHNYLYTKACLVNTIEMVEAW